MLPGWIGDGVGAEGAPRFLAEQLEGWRVQFTGQLHPGCLGGIPALGVGECGLGTHEVWRGGDPRSLRLELGRCPRSGPEG